MPQVSAADLRSAPSSTIARASIRRAAEPSFSRPAAARRSLAVKSSRVIPTAPPIDAAPLLGTSIESDFPRFGNPKMSQKPRPLVSHRETNLNPPVHGGGFCLAGFLSLRSNVAIVYFQGERTWRAVQ